MKLRHHCLQKAFSDTFRMDKVPFLWTCIIMSNHPEKCLAHLIERICLPINPTINLKSPQDQQFSSVISMSPEVGMVQGRVNPQ